MDGNYRMLNFMEYNHTCSSSSLLEGFPLECGFNAHHTRRPGPIGHDKSCSGQIRLGCHGFCFPCEGCIFKGRPHISFITHLLNCAITPKEGWLQELPGVVSLFCYVLMVKREFGVENYAKILCRIYCFQDSIMNFILWMFFFCSRVTSNTTHFSIDQSFSPICSVCKSLCNRSQSAVLSMTLYRRQSSAKSLGVLCSFFGRSFMYR